MRSSFFLLKPVLSPCKRDLNMFWAGFCHFLLKYKILRLIFNLAPTWICPYPLNGRKWTPPHSLLKGDPLTSTFESGPLGYLCKWKMKMFLDLNLDICDGTQARTTILVKILVTSGLARFAMVALGRPWGENLSKISENQWKSMENQWKSRKINKNQCKTEFFRGCSVPNGDFDENYSF